MAVKAGKEVIQALNEILTGELTAINQYFLHAKMLRHRGLLRLAKKIREESLDEMKHADELIERILYLEGVPNVQKLGRVRIGETVPEMFASDLALEREAVPRLNATIALCAAQGDNDSRHLLERILVNEEEHVEWLETQLELVETVGLTAYLSEQLKD